jgi:single-strand DNA-binding protein
MKQDLNKFLGMGNLTRNPELKYTPGGVAVLNMSMAMNSSFKTKAGEAKEETCFLEVVCFDRRAEVCAEYLHKGSRIFVEGRLQFDRWEDKDGNSRSKLVLRAMDVQFLDSKADREDQPAPREGAAPAGNMPTSDPKPPPADQYDDDIPF